MGVGFTQVNSIQGLPEMASFSSSIIYVADQPAAVAAPALPPLPVPPAAAPLPLVQPAPLRLE